MTATPTGTGPKRSASVASPTAAERPIGGEARGSRAAARQAKSAVKRADNRCPQGNRRKRDNSQFINQIRFCENYRVIDQLAIVPSRDVSCAEQRPGIGDCLILVHSPPFATASLRSVR